MNDNDAPSDPAPHAPAARLHYPLPRAPAAGDKHPILPGVHWVRLPLPFALDHINVWLLEDGDGWTLVDTGIAIDEVRALWTEALPRLLGGRPLARIVVTHHHPDHLGLAGWLAGRLDAEVWMTAVEHAAACYLYEGRAGADLERTRAHYARNGLREFDPIAPVESGRGYTRVISAPPASIHALRDGERITIGARTWEAMVTGGHADAHLSLHCPDLNALISGDHVLPAISSNISVRPQAPEADPLGCYLDSFARFEALDPGTWVLPSHGRVFTGLGIRTGQLRSHHARTLEQVRRLCARPHSAAALMAHLFPRVHDPLNTMLAFGETLAHAHRLEATGALRRQVNAHGVHEFVLAE